MELSSFPSLSLIDFFLSFWDSSFLFFLSYFAIIKKSLKTDISQKLSSCREHSTKPDSRTVNLLDVTLCPFLVTFGPCLIHSQAFRASRDTLYKWKIPFFRQDGPVEIEITPRLISLCMLFVYFRMASENELSSSSLPYQVVWIHYLHNPELCFFLSLILSKTREVNSVASFPFLK